MIGRSINNQSNNDKSKRGWCSLYMYLLLEVFVLVIELIIGPVMNAHIVWEVSHSWDEWQDFYQFLKVVFCYRMNDLPSFPKNHLFLTPLLIEDRILGLNRF